MVWGGSEWSPTPSLQKNISVLLKIIFFAFCKVFFLIAKTNKDWWSVRYVIRNFLNESMLFFIPYIKPLKFILPYTLVHAIITVAPFSSEESRWCVYCFL